MLSVKQFVNSTFNSNTYLVRSEINPRSGWLVDVGIFSDWFEGLHSHCEIEGIFLTHAHYDHIYAIHEVISLFPKCKIYCSEFTRTSLIDPKLNLSFYHEEPLSYSFDDIELLKEGDRIELFNGIELMTIETPGHNKGSLSFLLEQFIFTGDSLVPGHKVVTKLKSGNIDENTITLSKLNNVMKPDTLICSGHGPLVERQFINLE